MTGSLLGGCLGIAHWAVGLELACEECNHELERRLEEARRKADAKAHFLATMSHEIRTVCAFDPICRSQRANESLTG